MILLCAGFAALLGWASGLHWATLILGTSPGGKVYKIVNGKAEEYFAPDARYIWSLCVGQDKALYIAALKNTMSMFSETGKMDPKGAQAVLAVFSQSNPAIAKANIDLSKTYTNAFVEKAGK